MAGIPFRRLPLSDKYKINNSAQESKSIKAPHSPAMFLQIRHLQGCPGSSSRRPAGALKPCPSNCKSPVRASSCSSLELRAVRGHGHQAPPTPSTPEAMGSSTPSPSRRTSWGSQPSPSIPGTAGAPINLSLGCPSPPRKKKQASLRKPHGGKTRRVTHQKIEFAILP